MCFISVKGKPFSFYVPKFSVQPANVQTNLVSPYDNYLFIHYDKPEIDYI